MKALTKGTKTMAIDTVLFDFGAVLFEWDPERFVAQLRPLSEEQDILLREVIYSDEWVAMDRGELSQDTALEKILSRLPPAFHSDTTLLIHRWFTLGQPIPEVQEIARHFMQRGFRTYLASNSTEIMFRIREAGLVPLLEDFDGLGLSFELRAIKPERQFFVAICDKFGLQPTNCLFIDDRAENVQAAKEFGMAGIVFSGDVDALKVQISSLGL